MPHAVGGLKSAPSATDSDTNPPTHAMSTQWQHMGMKCTAALRPNATLKRVAAQASVNITEHALHLILIFRESELQGQESNRNDSGGDHKYYCHALDGSAWPHLKRGPRG